MTLGLFKNVINKMLTNHLYSIYIYIYIYIYVIKLLVHANLYKQINRGIICIKETKLF